MPYPAQMTVAYMSKNDWLYHYSTHFGIEMALKGLSRRSVFETNMHEAIADLKVDHEEIQAEFRPFFKDLMAHVDNEIKKF
jgi:acyl carrier protein phosphodiesterase